MQPFPHTCTYCHTQAQCHPPTWQLHFDFRQRFEQWNFVTSRTETAIAESNPDTELVAVTANINCCFRPNGGSRLAENNKLIQKNDRGHHTSFFLKLGLGRSSVFLKLGLGRNRGMSHVRVCVWVWCCRHSRRCCCYILQSFVSGSVRKHTNRQQQKCHSWPNGRF